MQIERATIGQLDQLAPLFDQYRRFYAQPADLAAARARGLSPVAERRDPP
ncbi:MAG TPA: hypothetical protein VE175_08600 [Woeseiaceae bacterium]|nr:hypothetical protein [Woeseiaceae bacterium]